MMNSESAHHGRELVTDALQMVITGKGERGAVESKVGDAIVILNAISDARSGAELAIGPETQVPPTQPRYGRRGGQSIYNRPA